MYIDEFVDIHCTRVSAPPVVALARYRQLAGVDNARAFAARTDSPGDYRSSSLSYKLELLTVSPNTGVA